MKRIKFFTIICNILFGIFMLLLFFNIDYTLPVYYLLMGMALLIIAINSYSFHYVRKRNKRTIFYFTGIVSGIILFLNPIVGSLFSSFSLILSSIIFTFF